MTLMPPGTSNRCLENGFPDVLGHSEQKKILVENFFLGLSHFFDHPGLRRFLLISDLGVFTGVIVDGQASETRSGYRGPKVRAGGEATRSNLEGPRCTLE